MQTHYNFAHFLLATGDFDAGWVEYEWRFRLFPEMARSLPQPCWQGEALDGRTILLHAEQGLGDTLQFVRYARARQSSAAAPCCSNARPSWSGMLRTCRRHRSHRDRRGAQLPPFDVQMPLLSLPRILKTTLATIPAAVPYLPPMRPSRQHGSRN